VDQLLFRANWASADRILADFQALQVGDFIPDGPPETTCGFIVKELERERRPDPALELPSAAQLAREGNRRRGLDLGLHAAPRGTGTDAPDLPVAARTRPWWLTTGVWAAIVPADVLMSRDMLQGLKRRVQTAGRANTARLAA
jgi:hypothetical protein